MKYEKTNKTNKKSILRYYFYVSVIILIFYIVVKILASNQNSEKDYDLFYETTNDNGNINLKIMNQYQLTFGACKIKVLINDTQIIYSEIANDGGKIYIDKNVKVDWLDDRTLNITFNGEEQADENVVIECFEDYIIVNRSQLGTESLLKTSEIYSLNSSLVIVQKQYIDKTDKTIHNTVVINDCEYSYNAEESDILNYNLESVTENYSFNMLNENKIELIPNKENLKAIVVEKIGEEIFVNDKEFFKQTQCQ